MEILVESEIQVQMDAQDQLEFRDFLESWDQWDPQEFRALREHQVLRVMLVAWVPEVCLDHKDPKGLKEQSEIREYKDPKEQLAQRECKGTLDLSAPLEILTPVSRHIQ